MSDWREIGERVFVRRYRFFDQNIVAVVGDDGVLVVDTRSTHRQGDEILDDLRSITRLAVTVVVNTHGHFDHCFGNHVFRPAAVWGHERCVTMIERRGEKSRARTAAEIPEIAADLREVVLDPPDRTFDHAAVVGWTGPRVELSYLGRGHTDNDIVIVVASANVLAAGDLLENDAVPYFGDSYPLDWPATAARLRALVDEGTVVVPGHGSLGDTGFVDRQVREFEAIAALGRRIEAGELGLDAALDQAPYPRGSARQPLERAIAQARGDITGD